MAPTTHAADLSAVPVVDHHAHPLLRRQPLTPEAFRRYFSEAHDDELARSFVGTSAAYLWTLRQLARLLGVAPEEEAVIWWREGIGMADYTQQLMQPAHLDVILLDTGYPPPAESYSLDEMEALLRIPVRPILRLETLVQDLILQHDSLSAVSAAFDATVAAARRDGYAALKSIAAYRSGLQIERVEQQAAEEAFAQVRQRAVQTGTLRLDAKPLVDYFLWRALPHAAAQELPLQFHTGYGDPDLDLRLANPLHLRPLFEDPAVRAVPIVLLHESYPYTAEAAYLAAVYPNAYLDIAFSLPPLGRSELRRAVETVLGAAPAGKVMCSSDGTCVPEHYWLGAVRARQVIGDVLGGMVSAGDLSGDEAQDLGTLVLRDNARRVYRL